MRKPMRLTAAALAVGLTGSAVTAAIGLVSGSADASPGVGFTSPLILPGGGAEPSIRTAPDGKFAAYVSAPSGLGSNFWRIAETRNRDGSVTLRSSGAQQPDLGTGGGDSEISIGSKPDEATGCNPIAYSGLHNIDLLDNFTTSVSTDCGATWSLANPYATQNTLTDRQWQAFDGAKTNFLIFHKVDTSQIVVTESPDGGKTYVSLDPEGARGIIDAQTMPAVANTNQVGNMVVDYATPVKGATNILSGEQVHTMYAIFAGPRDAADNAQAQADYNVTGTYNHNDTIYVAKSVDGGLNWADTKVFSVDPSTHRELNMLFPVVTTDKVGNVYAIWSDQFRVQYSVSTDHGATWSAPYQINRDNRGAKPDAGKADIFPWIAAGAKGGIDVVWYHAEGGGPKSNLTYRDPGDAKTRWSAAFAQLFGADRHVGKGAPRPTYTAYTEHATPTVHYGDICNNGLNCSLLPSPLPYSTGDRSLLDFFQVAIDNAGRANIAFAYNPANPGENISAYTRQNGGYSLLTGKPLPVQKVRLYTPPTGNGCTGPQAFDDFGDAKGTITGGVGQSNVDQLDLGRVRFMTPDGKRLAVQVAVKNLNEQPPAPSAASLYYVFWSYAGKQWFVRASIDAPGAELFEVGWYDAAADTYNVVGDASGTVKSGANGSLTWVFDRSLVGNPRNGAHLAKPHAATYSGEIVAAKTPQTRGLWWTTPIDKAPDTGSGADFSVGCAPGAPGAGAAASAPVAGKPGTPAAVTRPVRALGSITAAQAARATQPTSVGLRPAAHRDPARAPLTGLASMLVLGLAATWPVLRRRFTPTS